MLRSLALLLTAPALSLALAGAALADSITLEFERVTDNSDDDLSSQLSVLVTDQGDGTVLFVVTNGTSSSIVSCITDVYWGLESGSGTSSASVAGLLDTEVDFLASGSGSPTSTGVKFQDGASPADPPGLGGDWAGAAADADPPPAQTGVERGESAGFLLTMLDGVDWDDIVAGFQSGSLRMALHIQSIGTTGDSDTYQSVVPVPEPASVLLLGSAVGVAALARRRRPRSRA
jgi:hypothetical protein